MENEEHKHATRALEESANAVIDKVEKEINRTIRNVKITAAGIAFVGIAGMLSTNYYSNKELKTISNYNQIFLEQIGKLPTAIDSFRFYNNNQLMNYIKPKEVWDTKKSQEGNLIYLEIPEKEMKRVINENGLEKEVK